MTQCAFFFDQSRCSGCRSCAVACKSWHELPPGPLKYLKLYEYEKGNIPDVRIHFQWVPCYHCAEPVCMKSCPCDAIYKEDKYGAVLIDRAKCDGCRICYDVCPYGAPVFESDDNKAKAQKCTMCVDRLEVGLKPICVLACPDRALDFGHLETLRLSYGDMRDLEDMPGSRTTKPSVVFKPHAMKRRLVPYNAEKARKLLATPDLLHPVTASRPDVAEVPKETVGRGELVIKHSSARDLMRHTRTDEG